MEDTQDTFRSDVGRFVLGSRLLFKMTIECSVSNGMDVERILVQANAKIRARLKQPFISKDHLVKEMNTEQNLLREFREIYESKGISRELADFFGKVDSHLNQIDAMIEDSI